MKDFLSEITKAISDVANEVSRKADEAITVQGMKSQQRMSRREIEKEYIELGKLVYSKYNGGVKIAEEAVPHCEEIARLETQIAQFDADIAAYKAGSAEEEANYEGEIVDEVIDEVIAEEDAEAAAEEAASEPAEAEETVEEAASEVKAVEE